MTIPCPLTGRRRELAGIELTAAALQFIPIGSAVPGYRRGVPFKFCGANKVLDSTSDA